MNNVLSTKVTVYRNVKDFKFDTKLMPEQKQQIVQILANALEDKMTFVTLNQTDGNIINYLKSNDLVMQNTQNLFIAKNDRIAINLFNGEHLTLVSTCEGFNSDVVSKAMTIVQEMSSKINFVFNDEYGYLMSDISKVGAGIKIESNIMLSAITSINKMEQVKQNVAKLGFMLKETKFPAVYTLSTKCNLGLSESQIFEDFEKTLSKLQELEIESVKMLDATKHDELLDKNLRSLAILNAAHMLTYDELYNIIVNLRMGVNLGIVDLKAETLNKLQKLITGKTNDLVSQTELKELAAKVKTILKGE